MRARGSIEFARRNLGLGRTDRTSERRGESEQSAASVPAERPGYAPDWADFPWLEVNTDEPSRMDDTAVNHASTNQGLGAAMVGDFVSFDS